MECEALTADRAGVKTQGGNITLGRLVGQHCVLDAQAADSASSESSTSASSESSTSASSESSTSASGR